MAAVPSLSRFETLEFVVELDGRRQHCLVTIAALKSCFGATDETAARVLLGNLEELKAVAARVAQRAGPGERIVLRSADFRRSCAG
jgi:hypothetical protein